MTLVTAKATRSKESDRGNQFLLKIATFCCGATQLERGNRTRSAAPIVGGTPTHPGEAGPAIEPKRRLVVLRDFEKNVTAGTIHPDEQPGEERRRDAAAPRGLAHAEGQD